jgi:hypothetical protein
MIHSSCRALIALTLSLAVITVCQPAFAATGAKPPHGLRDSRPFKNTREEQTRSLKTARSTNLGA